MEIINQPPVTPQRFHALLKLVETLQQPKREDVQNCLQPPSLYNNQDTSRLVINFALNFSILIEDKDSEILKLANDVPTEVGDIESFRRFLQRRFTGVILPDADNYLLNQFTAWYAVQNERVYDLKPDELASNFSNEMYDRTDDSEGRAFNDTKFNGWRNWASFLGWGHTYSIQSAFPARFVPDAAERLIGALPGLFPDMRWITMSAFMESLADCCPELDGGILFNRCWEVSRPTELRGTQISLMLSTAIRVSQKRGYLEFKTEADARDTWQLVPAQGMINRVSHIRRVVT